MAVAAGFVMAANHLFRLIAVLRVLGDRPGEAVGFLGWEVSVESSMFKVQSSEFEAQSQAVVLVRDADGAGRYTCSGTSCSIRRPGS